MGTLIRALSDVDSMDGQDDLIRFLRETAGDDLRALIQYEGEDLDLERDSRYVRDDITVAGDADLETVVRQFRLAEPIEDRREALLDLGTHHVTFRLYDDAILVHFPQGSTVGTILSLDVAFLPEVADFIGHSVDYINRETPQRIETLPSWHPD